MKNLTLLICVLLFLGSCKAIPLMGVKPESNPKPYVLLKSGKKIEGSKVTVTNRKVKADKTAYKKKDVSSFSDGKDIYASYSKKGFAKKMAVGDINVYYTKQTDIHTEYVPNGIPASYNPQHTYSSGGTWKTSTHTHVKVFLQKTDTGNLVFLDYKHEKKLIPLGDPGYLYLKTFRQHRLVDRLVMVGGLGMFVGGAVMAGNSINSTSASAGPGLAVLFGGMGVIGTGAIMGGFNHINLYRAISKHNGVHPVEL